MTALAVEAHGIRVTYGEGAAACDALKEVSVEVRTGEVLLLMGPSGSGKTTLTQVLGCLLRPTAGSVAVFGRRVEGLDGGELGALRLRHYGFIFQSYNLFPALTAWENVAMTLDLLGIRGSEAEDRARRLLDEVGLSHKADSYPAKLSGGQRQRVAIARALAADPKILLADEPTAALDAASGQNAVALLARLARTSGRAVVIVTHDGRVAAAGDRIITLDDGRIVATRPDLH
jgi:putative ABC transport system ATP-binding protein